MKTIIYRSTIAGSSKSNSKNKNVKIRNYEDKKTKT